MAGHRRVDIPWPLAVATAECAGLGCIYKINNGFGVARNKHAELKLLNKEQRCNSFSIFGKRAVQIRS